MQCDKVLNIIAPLITRFMLSDALKASFSALAYRLRASILKMTTQAGSGHPTSAFSCVEIMVVLVWYALRFDPSKKFEAHDDQFVLSKGHAVPVWYAVWHELGHISEHDLLNFRQFNSTLEGHPTPRFERVTVATGSLGQGLAVAVGMALDAARDGYDLYTYVLLGDSELAEGSVWEAASLASFYQLASLIVIVDCNKLGQTGPTAFSEHSEIYRIRFEAFGWEVKSVDGHSFQELTDFFDHAHANGRTKPLVLLAETIKGYPLLYWAGKNGFHGKTMPSSELPRALEDLKKECGGPINAPAPLIKAPQRSIRHEITYNRQVSEFPTYKKEDSISLRRAFGETLASLAHDRSLIVLDAEVKNSTYTELFERVAPEQFVQAFIAEQAMVSMGTGFAARKKRVCMATFGAFLTRAHDQLRMAAISQLPLLVVGTHCGVSVGADGPSQMALEDIALFRTLPDSLVLYPADAQSTAFLIRQAINTLSHSIIYIRLTRQELPILYDSGDIFSIGSAKLVRSSPVDKACLVAAGITLHEALKAYESLKDKGIFVSVVDLYCIKPVPVDFLVKIAQKSNNHIFIFEDHYAAGGIGEAVMHALAGTSIFIDSSFVSLLPRSGSSSDLLEWAKIDAYAQTYKVFNFFNQ